MKVRVLRIAEGLSWPEIQQRTTNVLGETAGDKAVREAVARIESMEDGALVPKTKYDNCGRKKSLPDSTEKKMIEFVKNGFVVLPLPELSPEYHAKCADSIMNPWEKNDRNNNWIGNNIFPANADLGPVLATPTVRGALSSVLGPDYAFHAHRALHVSGSNDQGFHKDTPEGGGPIKHMRPRWAMIM